MADHGRWSSWIWGSDMLASANTLPEHYSALALLQQLDHVWFQDNLLKPRVGLIDAFLPSSETFSPYQSIELTDAAHSKWCASSFAQSPRSGKMPCARFESLSCTHALRKTPDSGNGSSSDGCKDALEPDLWPHQPPQCAHELVSQRHVSLRPRTDTLLVSPAPLQAWFAKDLLNLKEFEEEENFQERKLKSVDIGKQVRVSLVDGQLHPQPSLLVVGTKRAQRKSSETMTILEFDELQRFMDLGFHFSQDDLTPRIVRMFPALQHKLEEAGGSKKSPRSVLTKPKQSSAATWLVQRSSNPLHHWQIPATGENMKEHLKFWARAVALTVRQEC